LYCSIFVSVGGVGSDVVDGVVGVSIISSCCVVDVFGTDVVCCVDFVVVVASVFAMFIGDDVVVVAVGIDSVDSDGGVVDDGCDVWCYCWCVCCCCQCR